jgi:hypothetical protein
VQRVTITNHPIGGPVFSGPQLQPWYCSTEADGLGPPADAQCNAPTVFKYHYKSSITGLYAAYDPDNPPSDVAMTTTDQGKTVPFIVRVEKGTLDRGIHQIAVLFDPSQPWEPWSAQPGWNHKLYVTFGPGAAFGHRQQISPAVVSDADLDEHNLSLSRGFMVARSSLLVLGNNINTTLEAEVLMMLKEHIVETYGEIRYTVGGGYSGGAIGQHAMANMYPGLLQGTRTEGSFPDAGSIINVASFDCPLLNRYFDNVSPDLWRNPAQRNAVYGYAEPSSCTIVHAPENWNPSQGHDAAGVVCVEPDVLYNAETRRDGVRCTVQDYLVAIVGRRPRDGFANRWLDNVGLQYGLAALQSGAITPAQFVDLNEKVGGWDIDANFQPGRSVADLPALEAMYRSGQISSGEYANQVAEIDARIGSNNDIHSNLQQQIYRARLLRTHGHADFSVSWYEPVIGIGGLVTPATGELTFLTVDRWLAAVEADTSEAPLADKILAHRPGEARDACVASGQFVLDESCTVSRLYFGDPRIVAGMPLTRDVLKCQLKPLDRADYAVEFSGDEWARLQAAFPEGVCDWSRPSVGYQPTVPWATFANGPGGEPLGEPPVSRPAD